MMTRTHSRYAALGLILAAGAAHADGFDPLKGALGETKPIIDLRLRSESVEQTPFAEDASALTLRARLGFETGKAWNTSLLVEGDLVAPLQEDYNSTTNGKTAFPVVADPEVYEINRLQLTNTSLPGTTLTLGRQRIALDDQRFVGPVGWRQNEQTFDAFRVVNRSLKKFVFDFSYLNQVERVFGPDSPQGRFEGDSVLANVSYATTIGKLTGYGYLLDFDNIAAVPAAVRDSSSTYGLRLTGDKPVGKVKLAYVAAYAMQTEYADNPLDFDLDYLNAEITASFRQFGLGAGIEVLEGNGVKGFTTPLATLHKFQGWADKFLATPPNGLKDSYLNASATFKGIGPLDTLGIMVSFHDFGADRISADYGSEVDLQLAAKWKRVNLLVKYADFSEGVLASARDTQKLWAQVEFIW